MRTSAFCLRGRGLPAPIVYARAERVVLRSGFVRFDVSVWSKVYSYCVSAPIVAVWHFGAATNHWVVRRLVSEVTVISAVRLRAMQVVTCQVVSHYHGSVIAQVATGPTRNNERVMNERITSISLRMYASRDRLCMFGGGLGPTSASSQPPTSGAGGFPPRCALRRRFKHNVRP